MLSAVIAASVLASARPARADTQLWVIASMTKTLSRDWRLAADVAPRWERDWSDYSRTVLRAQIARMARRDLAVGVGYEFQNPAARFVRREHRIWQQVQLQQSVGPWAISHRARLEQRWLRGVDPLVVRARYQLRAGLPFASGGRWSWLLLDEVLYIVRGDDLAYAQGLDRHRLGTGIGRALSPHLLVESGYTWQTINRPGALPVQHDHLIVLNVVARY